MRSTRVYKSVISEIEMGRGGDEGIYGVGAMLLGWIRGVRVAGQEMWWCRCRCVFLDGNRWQVNSFSP